MRNSKTERKGKYEGSQDIVQEARPTAHRPGRAHLKTGWVAFSFKDFKKFITFHHKF